MKMENLEKVLQILESDNVIFDYEILSDTEVNIMNKVIKNEEVFLRVYTFSFKNSKVSIEIEDLDFDD